MAELPQYLIEAVRASSWLEGVAVLLAVAYLLLATRQELACWYAAFVSSAIFCHLFFDVGLPMASALQIYFLFMAVYGWWQWQRGGARGAPLRISRKPWQWHLLAITAVLCCSGLTGYLLEANPQLTEARLPYLDSFTSWASVLATWMVARKLLENWLYWLVIDGIYIALCLDRELYLTALLYGLYLVIALFAWHSWRQSYRRERLEARE